MADLHYADYIVFAVLLLVSGLVGPFYMWRDRKEKVTTESYFVGDRAMHVLPIAVSIFASFWSATALIGIPAELYTGGAKFFMSTVGQIIGTAIGALLFVPMLYKLKLLSTYQYLEMRFNSKIVRYIGTTAGVITSLLNLAVTIYAPCVALSAVSPIPIWASITATGVVTMMYTVLGGIKAVVIVDFIQAIVMFLGVLVATTVGYTKLNGNFQTALQIASRGGRLDFADFNPDLRNTYSFYAMVLPPLLLAAGHHATSQAAVQRYSAVPNVKQAIWSMLAMLPQILLFKAMLLFLALAMYVHYELQGCDPLRGKIITTPNQLTTYYVAEVLNYPGLVGLWFAALFSGSLSTLSTGCNSVSAVIWDGLLKNRYESRFGQRHVSLMLKLITLFIGIASSLLAFAFQSVSGSVIKMTMSTVNVFGASVILCYFVAAFLPFVNAIGVICGMFSATGLICFVAIGQMIFRLGNEQAWLPTTTENCASFFNLPLPSSWPPEQFQNLTDSSSLLNNAHLTTKQWNDPTILPSALLYLFSISYFLFPLFSVLIGIFIAIVVSLLTGGLVTARSVENRFLIVKNCFLLSPSDTFKTDETISPGAQISKQTAL